MFKLVIDRGRWSRGGGDTIENQLVLENGFGQVDGGEDEPAIPPKAGDMCCLGFLGRACKIPKSRMVGVADPASLAHNGVKLNGPIEKLVNKEGDNTIVCTKLMNANDTPGISEKVREARIKLWMKKIGVSVTFKG